MNLVGKSEFARIAGVSPAAITKAIRQGKVAVKDGKVDLDDEITTGYLQDRAEKKAAAAPPPRPRRRRGADAPPDDEDSESRPKMDRRHFELEKAKHQALHLKLKNAVMMGTMVRRDDVIRSVMNPINTVFIRLLSDVSKTIAAQIKPMIEGGASVEEIEIFVRDQHSTCLKNLKAQMKRALSPKRV